MKDRSNELAELIIGTAIEVHRNLEPGLLENVYEQAMVYELEQNNIPDQQQVPVPTHYKGFILSQPLKLDLLIDNTVIVELKAVDKLAPIYQSQLLTYLEFKNL